MKNTNHNFPIGFCLKQNKSYTNISICKVISLVNEIKQNKVSNSSAPNRIHPTIRKEKTKPKRDDLAPPPYNETVDNHL